MKRIITTYGLYLGIAIFGGFIAFIFHSMASLLIATSITSVTSVDIVLNIGTNLLVLLGGIAIVLFSKHPMRMPAFCFALGFVLINKIFEWVFVAWS